MKTEFFLASHDYISSPEPRKCLLLQEIYIENRKFYTIKVSPPLPSHLTEKNQALEILCIVPCAENISLDRVGSSVVMVDIYFLDSKNFESLTKKMLQRIGVGTLHEKLDDAKKASPL